MTISLPPTQNFQNIWTGNNTLIWSGLNMLQVSLNCKAAVAMLHKYISKCPVQVHNLTYKSWLKSVGVKHITVSSST